MRLRALPLLRRWLTSSPTRQRRHYAATAFEGRGAAVAAAEAQLRAVGSAVLTGRFEEADALLSRVEEQLADDIGGVPPWVAWPMQSAKGALAAGRGEYGRARVAYGDVLLLTHTF
eukprot:COSAG05_NODE_7111_length_854_cov_2.827815_1_plen_116_part_00